MKFFPKANSENVFVQKLNRKEVLIYDSRADQVFCLNETSGVVYQACDGVTTFEDIKTEFNFTDDLIYLALAELRRKNLIEVSPSDEQFSDLKKSEQHKIRLGFSNFSLPLITSLT